MAHQLRSAREAYEAQLFEEVLRGNRRKSLCLWERLGHLRRSLPDRNEDEELPDFEEEEVHGNAYLVVAPLLWENLLPDCALVAVRRFLCDQQTTLDWCVESWLHRRREPCRTVAQILAQRCKRRERLAGDAKRRKRITLDLQRPLQDIVRLRWK